MLAAVYAGRLAVFRADIRADVTDPRRAFGFFSVAAGSDVLAARLAGDARTAPAVVLLVIGGISWALLSYSLPLLVAGGDMARLASRWPAGRWE